VVQVLSRLADSLRFFSPVILLWIMLNWPPMCFPTTPHISQHSCTSCVIGKMHTQPFESHSPHHKLLQELCAHLSFPPRSVPLLAGATTLLGIYKTGSSFKIVHPICTKVRHRIQSEVSVSESDPNQITKVTIRIRKQSY
jgi:hypothetical protein